MTRPGVTEALEQQTATSEILRVISQLADRRPAGVRRDRRERRAALRRGVHCRLPFDGELLASRATRHRCAGLEASSAAPYPRPGAMASRPSAILERAPSTSRHPDRCRVPVGRTGAAARIAAIAASPCRCCAGGEPIGIDRVTRRGRAFHRQADRALLQTFADQAVIAIENVRLFTELQASNRELTTALDTQTATSDILRVISRSPTDVQPVFDAIAESAVGLRGRLGRSDSDRRRSARARCAHEHRRRWPECRSARFRDRHPPGRDGRRRAIRDRGHDPISPTTRPIPSTPRGRAAARARGFRSRLVVPMLRDGEAIGRSRCPAARPGGFTDDEIALLQTFADQAVIAIENARLFTELQARTAS